MTMSGLVVENVTKAFPGVLALDDVSFVARTGEVVGLIGENGAGKSTLLKLLNGVYQPDKGRILMDGRPIHISSPRDGFDQGIAMVFQEQSVITSLTVAENIFLGREKEFLQRGLISKKRMNEAAAAELKKVRLDVDPRMPVARLTFGQRQMVEIAKALSLDQRISGNVTILLDEPTSVLDAADIDLLFENIENVKQRASIVFISHRLSEVLRVSDRLYVMRNGKVVHECSAEGTKETDLHSHMVGRNLSSQYYREDRQLIPGEDVVMRVENLGRKGHFHDVSFELRKGEILGFAGTIGSGREEIVRCIGGYEIPDSGTIEIGGKQSGKLNVRKAVGLGVGLVPSERKIEGLITSFPVADNITVCQLGDFSSFGLIRRSDQAAVAKEWIGKLNIKTPSEWALVEGLSGGNQQKVVLAKWRVAGVDVLILDHPTRGVDIGAKEDVYELVREITSKGVSIILLGDTLAEIIGLSNRIIVLKDGAISAELDASRGAKPLEIDVIRQMI